MLIKPSRSVNYHGMCSAFNRNAILYIPDGKNIVFFSVNMNKGLGTKGLFPIYDLVD